MIIKIKIFVCFALALSNYSYGQAPPNADNIFIGSFYTFDPYIVGEYQLKRDAPEFDTKKIFFWIKADSLDSNINKVLVLDLKDDRESDFSFKLYVLDYCLLKDSTILKPDQSIFFIYNCRNYSSVINTIYYYDGWSKGYFASVDLPTEGDFPHDDFNLPFFSVVGSLNKNMKIYLDRFSTGQYDDEDYRYRDYTVKSSLFDTGQYGYFDAKIFDSFLSVEYNSKEVFRFSSQSQLSYYVGDFNGNGLISLYILEGSLEGRQYTIIEISENDYDRKSYFQQSAE